MSTLSLRPDPTVSRIFPESHTATQDHFDRLPDSLLLLVFNKLADVKSLGRCSLVSHRFHSLVPFSQNVAVRVDCIISDEGNDNDNDIPSPSAKSPSPFSTFLRSLLSNLLKPLHFFSPNTPPSQQNGVVTHHSPTQVLKNFNDIRSLRIELPTGELGIDGGVLLKWRAHFGSTLDNCVILGASSAITNNGDAAVVGSYGHDEDNGSIPDSFYTNGGLKLRVVWTISSLIAASARHYLLQPIISEHKTLEHLVLTDGDGQGVLCMNKDQLEELRVKPLSASSASKRTLVPALTMKLWYAPHLELGDGIVLKGATLVAIWPSELSQKKEASDVSWVSMAFEEPYRTAARMLGKRRTYCLEMNSF